MGSNLGSNEPNRGVSIGLAEQLLAFETIGGRIAPNVLHKLLIERNAPAVRLKDLWYAIDLPWAEQEGAIFPVPDNQ